MSSEQQPRVATVSVAATVGEWLQVHHPKHGRVHVSCPVGWRTTTRVELLPALGDPVLQVTRPSDWGGDPQQGTLGSKSQQLLAQLCTQLGIPESVVRVKIDSPIPTGKGFASSTADLVGIAWALFEAAEKPVSPEVIHDSVIGIEPSDATMFPGIVTAKLDEPGVLAVHTKTPPVAFVTVIPSATLETEHQPPSTPHPEADRMLAAMGDALASQDLGVMARLATESGSLAQERITTPHWQLVNDIAAAYDGLGVIIGHSGTLSAIICATTHRAHASRLTELTATLTQETNCPIAIATPDLSGPQLTTPPC